MKLYQKTIITTTKKNGLLPNSLFEIHRWNKSNYICFPLNPLFPQTYVYLSLSISSHLAHIIIHILTSPQAFLED